jgi:hypothetical protein
MFADGSSAMRQAHILLRTIPLACLVVPGIALAQSGEADGSGPSSERRSDVAEEAGPSSAPRVIIRHSVQVEFNVAPPKLVEEVTVRGQMPSSGHRRRAEAAVEQAWEAFNETNSDDAFNVRCGYEASTGTRIRQHVCRPQFWDDAASRAAQAVLQFDGSGSIGHQQSEAAQAHDLEVRLREELRDTPADRDTQRATGEQSPEK